MSLYARPAQEDTMAEINVTPFTDVLLVLMIIFILLASMVAPPGFEKSLNNNCAIGCGAHRPKHAPVDISVTPTGRIFVGTQAVDENTIYGALAAIGRRDAKTPIRLIGDRRAPYGPVIRTLDAAKAAGLDNVTFVTQ